ERERQIAEQIGVDIGLKVDLGLVDRGASRAWTSVVAEGESPDEVVVRVLAEGLQVAVQDNADRRVKRAYQGGKATRCRGRRWRRDGRGRLLETGICGGRRGGGGREGGWRYRCRYGRRSLTS